MTNIVLKAPELDEHRDALFDNWRALTRWLERNSDELLTAAAIGIGIFALLLLLRWLACRIAGGDGTRGWRAVFQAIVSRTHLLFLALLSVELVTMQAVLPRRADDIIEILFIIAAALQAAIWIRAFVISLVEQKVGEGQEHRSLGTAISLIRVLVTIAAFLIAGIVILDNLGVDVTGLIAGLGIGGIAIGLAAQGIFSDLFAALAIIFDRPFRKGDTINVGGGTGGQTGTVENIGLKTTRLRSLDGELVAYGNAELLKMRIHNYALQDHRRVVMRFGVTYETPPDLLDAIPREVQAVIETCEHAVFDRSHLMGFGASSLDYETVYVIQTADYATFAQARHEIMLAILRRFAELDIAFAYPTQTTYTAAPDGTLVMPWPSAPAKS